MSFKSLSPLSIAFALWSGVHADWGLRHPADAPDSMSARKFYGIRAVRNVSSTATVRVESGAVVLEASRIASDSATSCTGTKCLRGWSARVGIDHPLFADGTPRDLKGLRKISFEFRNADSITGYLGVGLVSARMPDLLDALGMIYEAPLQADSLLAAGSAWKRVEIDAEDFATPSWWRGSLDLVVPFGSILAAVRGLRFVPYGAYQDSGTFAGEPCGRCAGPSMTSQTLQIRNIVLTGVEKYPDPPAGDCSGEMSALDILFDNHVNEAGSSWIPTTDSDSNDASGSDTAAVGQTTSRDTLLTGDEFSAGAIRLDASLDRVVDGSVHSQAGWAALETDFCNTSFIHAMSFHLQADSMPASVEGVRLRVRNRFATGGELSVMIPSRLLGSGGRDFCIAPQMLDTAMASETDALVESLAWEVRIAGPGVADEMPVPVSFKLGNVRLFNFYEIHSLSQRQSRCGTGAVLRRTAPGAMVVTWANGVLSLQGFDCVASASVLGLDGRILSSFAPAARVPLRLPRGAWILEARMRDGTVLRRSFVALDR